MAGSVRRRPSPRWPPWPPPRRLLLLGGAVQRGKKREIENEVWVLGKAGGHCFIPAKIVDGRRIETDGADRPKLCWAKFDPGGFQLCRPRPTLRPGRRVARAGGRWDEFCWAEIKPRKKIARVAGPLCHPAREHSGLQASCRAGRAWGRDKIGQTAVSTQFFRFSFSRSYN